MAATAQEPDLRQPQSPFLALPLELIIETLTFLSNDRSALCSLARTCRLLQPFCEDQIYRTVELHNTDDLQAICHAFAQHSRRVEAVHALRIFYKYHRHLAGTIEDREVLNSCIKQMKTLQEWHIESPFDNFHWGEAGGAEWVGRDMDMFRQALEASSLHQGVTPVEDIGLAKLQKLTIHSHGVDADFWDLDGFHCLFRHPALRYLHISCVTLPADLPELEPFAATTPLQTLIFDECELNPKSLGRILSTPKSLKHLTLGENIANIRRTRGPSPKLTPASEAAMHALMPVAHSLETLTHYDPTYHLLPDPQNAPAIKLKGTGMREFHHLKLMNIHRSSFLHQGIILSPALAPPNLETLQLQHGHGEEPPLFFENLPKVTPYTFLPSLKSVEFVQPLEISRRTFRFFSNFIGERDALQERHAAAYQLWKRGINMKIYGHATPSKQFIPPFLHGEPLPELLTVYDAAEIGFRTSMNVDMPHRYPGPRAETLPPNVSETDKLTAADIGNIQTQVHDTVVDYHRRITNAQPEDLERRGRVLLQLPDGTLMVVDDQEDFEDMDDIDGSGDEGDESEAGWSVDDGGHPWEGDEDEDEEWEEHEDENDTEFEHVDEDGALHDEASLPLAHAINLGIQESQFIPNLLQAMNEQGERPSLQEFMDVITNTMQGQGPYVHLIGNNAEAGAGDEDNEDADISGALAGIEALGANFLNEANIQNILNGHGQGEQDGEEEAESDGLAFPDDDLV